MAEVAALVVVSSVEESRGRFGAELLGSDDHRCAARAAVRAVGPDVAYEVWMGRADPAVATSFARRLDGAYDGCVAHRALVTGVADLLAGQRRFVFVCLEGRACRTVLPTDDEYGCIAGRLVDGYGTRGAVDLLAGGAGGGALDALGRVLGPVAERCLLARYDPCGQADMKSDNPCMPATKIPLPIT